MVRTSCSASSRTRRRAATCAPSTTGSWRRARRRVLLDAEQEVRRHQYGLKGGLDGHVGRLAALAQRLEQAQEPIELGLGGGPAEGAADELAQALAHAVAVAPPARREAVAKLRRLERLLDDLLRRVEVLLQEDGRER